MLQATVEPQYGFEEQNLDLRQYYAIAKKRVLYFLIPFVLVAIAGTAAALLWPPTYLSEGKILVESQHIPTELVRPTVSAAGKERLQILQQRVTSRDNLLALADKYGLYADRRDRLSRTELLDLVRESVRVESVDLDPNMGSRSQTIALKVGFMDRRPDVANRVANELMTLFLNEDARNRTSRATETTRFLAREAQRLENELSNVEAKVAEALKQQRTVLLPGPGGIQQPSPLMALKAEYAQKTAVYRASHPELRRLAAQIAALEKADLPPTPSTTTGGTSQTPSSAALDSLLVQRAAAQKNLEDANQKLSAARLGESLERDQFSERLEVLEQAVTPQKPLKPNRLKIIALAMFGAMMAGVGGVFAVESLDRTIRGTQDLARVTDSRSLVIIPFISTARELSRKKRRLWIIPVVLVLSAVGALVAVHFLVRPLDELWPLLLTRLMDGIPRW